MTDETPKKEAAAELMKKRIAEAKEKAEATEGGPNEKARIVRDANTPTTPDSITGGVHPEGQEELHDETLQVTSRQHYYKLPSGATRYVTQHGKTIIAPLGVVAEWEDEDTAEFEANVKARIWRKFPIDALRTGLDKPPASSIVASGRTQ